MYSIVLHILHQLRGNTMTSYKWGAIFYILWGIMHAMIGIQILALNLGESTYSVIETLYSDSGDIPTPKELGSVVEGLMNQHAWNLLWFGLFAIIVGGIWNWRNNIAGYWANLAVISLADIGFIVAILIPGYISIEVGIWGPVLWVLAIVFTTKGQRV